MSDSKKLLVGIDEAGYGPNFGPLVVAAVSLEVPRDTKSHSLWDQLAPTVGRWTPPSSDEPAGRALIVDDSKVVYASGDGLGQLELSALAWCAVARELPKTLRDLWQAHCVTDCRDVDEVPWYAGRDAPLPQLTPHATIAERRSKLAESLARAGCARPGIACQIIMPRLFNEMVAQRGTKSDALFDANAELLRSVWLRSETPTAEVIFDKHGGRNFYWPLLQRSFHETLVLTGREGPKRSQYSMTWGGRSLEATFVPRADGDHLLVAWASMLAKYIRELWMKLFNDYWTDQVPGLRPTAGYPVDSRRFWKDIRSRVKQLGIARHTLWRVR